MDNSNFNENFNQIKDLIKIAKKKKKILFFISIYKFSRKSKFKKKKLNNQLLKINIDLENIYLKTFDQNISKLFSERNRIYIRFPFELKFIDFITNEIKKNILYFSSKPYKLIIVDCDNTLWGGILDEDGCENLKYDGDGIGQIFYQFQLFLKNKIKEGYVISISSKTMKEVWNAMKKRGMTYKKRFHKPKNKLGRQSKKYKLNN